MIQTWGCVILVSVTLFVFSSDEAVAESDSDRLNTEGIKLYRAKQLDESVKTFRSAISSAKPDTWEELTAVQNLSLPLESLKREAELWQVRRRACVLRLKLQGTPIPEEYNGETPQEVEENSFKKSVLSARDEQARKVAKLALLHWYETQLDIEKSQVVFDEIVESMPQTAPDLPGLFRLRSDFLMSKQKICEAETLKRRAKEAEQRISELHAQEEAREKADHHRLAMEEQRRQRLAKEHSLLAAKQKLAEDARNRALAVEASERKRQQQMLDQQRLQRITDADFVGHYFSSTHGGSLKFVSASSVDITPFGSLIYGAGIARETVSGQWTFTHASDGYPVLRIEYVYNGANRVTYSMVAVQDGRLVIMCQTEPPLSGHVVRKLP